MQSFTYAQQQMLRIYLFHNMMTAVYNKSCFLEIFFIQVK